MKQKGKSAFVCCARSELTNPRAKRQSAKLMFSELERKETRLEE
jgi:hypothetical protein